MLPPRALLRTTIMTAALLGVHVRTAHAQSAPVIDGPPSPVAPAVISRDAAGRATVRAIKLATPLRLDGVLDEAVYAREAPFDGMIQSAPAYGEPSTERSDIWITYDSENIYLSCRCWDASPPEEWVLNELRRDTDGLRNNEHIGVLFDTFYDRRSGFAFYTNPLGARADYSVVDEGDSNADWNPVWTSKPGRFDGGWTVEMAIPFKSLRYRAGNDQMWGVQIRRGIRHKNEWNYLTPVPRVMAGPRAFNRVSAGGTLVGLDLPPAGRNIELKPYAVGRLTTDRLAAPPVNDAWDGEFGGDIKYAVTPNLTADITINTDFAQVEVDEQQLNLTRFGLFFPEKREFFLEGRGTFDFGRGGSGGGGNGSNTPYLFYSRRIGLNNGAVIPINLGGRLTGKLGPYAVGLMSVGTRNDVDSGTEGTNFTVVRLKRDILQRSSVGVMATNRSVATSGVGSNFAYGVDGAFLLTEALTFGTYWARSATTGVEGDDQSYQARLDYSADRYGAQAEFLSVGANFDPQVGFRRRADFDRSSMTLRFSPRPSDPGSRVLKYTWTMSGEYIEDGSGTVDARGFEAGFETEFTSSDELSIDINHDYEFLRLPFTPSGSPAPIAAGGYTYSSGSIQYRFGAQRRASGSVRVEAGEYYDGHVTSLSLGTGGPFSSARIAIARQLALEPSFQITRVERSAGSFTTRLARLRVNYSFSPLMFASALVQYNSAGRTFSTNIRYRWEYAPGSELFLVYTDERDMTPQDFVPAPALRGLRNRALVVKISRLLRY